MAENDNQRDWAAKAGDAIDSFSKLKYWRHIWMTALSLIVVFIVLTFSFYKGEEIFCYDAAGAAEAGRSILKACNPPEGAPTGTGVFGLRGDPRTDFLLPYAVNLAGVLLFILATARKKGEEWSLGDYWGAHVFRIAQSAAYTFLILWAWPKLGADEAVPQRLGPYVLGFLVGLYILRVERVMEAFGEKFEEVLAAILPRSLRFTTAEERRRQQLRAVYRLDDIVAQWEAIRPQIDDPGARVRVDELIAAAQEAQQGDEPEKAQEITTELSRQFEEAKRSAGEVLMRVEDLVTRGA
jgi:hypothetical protein